MRSVLINAYLIFNEWTSENLSFVFWEVYIKVEFKLLFIRVCIVRWLWLHHIKFVIFTQCAFCSCHISIWSRHINYHRNLLIIRSSNCKRYHREKSSYICQSIIKCIWSITSWILRLLKPFLEVSLLRYLCFKLHIKLIWCRITN